MNTQTQEALNGLKHLEHVSAQLKTYSDQGQHKHIPSYLSAGHCYEIAKEMDSVIKACKEALAQPAQEIGDAEIKQMLDDIEYYQKRVEELEQQAQEPVAWLYKRENSSGGWYVVTNYEKENDNGTRNIECYDIPLYTNPAPLWQGLSDDVVASIWMHEAVPMNGQDFKRVYRAIEQALKEKNT